MFFKKATTIDEIFTDDLTLCNKCQIDREDFVNTCGLLKKHELYHLKQKIQKIYNNKINQLGMLSRYVDMT